LDEVDRLHSLGHKVVEIDLPDRDELTEAHGVLACVEAREAWAGEWPHGAMQLGETVRRTLAYAQNIDADLVHWARTTIRRALSTIGDVFCSVDVVIGSVT